MTALRFADVVEAADRLTLDEQETLIEILRRRVIQAGRERLIADVLEAEREFAEGECKPATAEEIMREVLE